MKALSIKQPFAQLILRGSKTIEVRSWDTDYRGPLAIHAAKTDARKGLPEDWPRGAVICVCDLVDVRPYRIADRKPACLTGVRMGPGRWYAWVLENVQPLVEPVAVVGRQRLFDLPLHLDANGAVIVVES